MKKIAILFLCALAFAACRNRQVTCLGIQDDISGWFPYSSNQSLQFKDQHGHDSTIVIASVQTGDAYQIKESRSMLRKRIQCDTDASLQTADNSFRIDIGAQSLSSSDPKRKPDYYEFMLALRTPGTPRAGFNFMLNQETISFSDETHVTLESNYVIGNGTYSEALVYTSDGGDNSSNIEQIVYAKGKGLVQFTTKIPHKTWTLQ